MNRCEAFEENGLSVVRLAGEVDLSWSQDVRRAVLAAVNAGGPVAVDLAAVDYIDSSGIAALVEGFQRSRGKGGSFVLRAPSQAVNSVLKLARLDRVFEIEGDASST